MPWSILTMLGQMITSAVKGWQDLQAAKQQTLLAAENNKARLLEDKEANNHAWEMAQLTDADKWTRRISFICFTTPFIIAVFAPNAVKNYFVVAISSIPDWYKITYMSITGAIWGIASLKDPMSQFISHFKE